MVFRDVWCRRVSGFFGAVGPVGFHKDSLKVL